jgi:hypothetical protein
VRTLREALLVVVATASAAAGLDVSHFTRVREITPDRRGPANYVVIDEDVLGHSRPDLGDLRIYSGETQIPYVLLALPAESHSVERASQILNLGAVGGNTEFDLDMSGATQYNYIRLGIDAKNFVASAHVVGKDSLAGGSVTDLGTSTLFDFSREGLGSYLLIKLPSSTFRYLHVRLDPGIGPQHVKGAWAYSLEERKSFWTNIGWCSAPRQVRPTTSTSDNPQGKPTTIFDCNAPPGTMIDRVLFSVPDGQANFRRAVTITESGSADQGQRLVVEGNISRLQLQRGGTVVNSQALSIPMGHPHQGHLLITVFNEDDAPLDVTAVQPQAAERRIFFEPKGTEPLRMYYGDNQLQSPTYDYAKLFSGYESSVPASMGSAQSNVLFRERPDERPWSERHHAVLWVVMITAVAGLGFLALRGLKQS